MSSKKTTYEVAADILIELNKRDNPYLKEDITVQSSKNFDVSPDKCCEVFKQIHLAVMENPKTS